MFGYIKAQDLYILTLHYIKKATPTHENGGRVINYEWNPADNRCVIARKKTYSLAAYVDVFTDTTYENPYSIKAGMTRILDSKPIYHSSKYISKKELWEKLSRINFERENEIAISASIKEQRNQLLEEIKILEKIKEGLENSIEDISQKTLNRKK